MSVCTSTVMMKPAKVDCDSASANTRLVSASASAPPYCALVHQAEQAGLAHAAQHVARHAALLFPGGGMRLDLAGDEARDLVAQQLVLGGVVDGCVGHDWPHIRNTPNFGSGIGALSVADRPSASTRRVSAGSITPSSHSRAGGVVGMALHLVLLADRLP